MYRKYRVRARLIKEDEMKRKIKIPDGVYRDRYTGMLVKKIKTGTGRFIGMSLWQPMKRGLFSYVPDYSKESFWYDSCDYVKAEDEK